MKQSPASQASDPLSFDDFKFNTLVLRLPNGAYRLDIHIYENPDEYIGSIILFFAVSGVM